MAKISMRKMLCMLFSAVLVLGLAPGTLYAQPASDDDANVQKLEATDATDDEAATDNDEASTNDETGVDEDVNENASDDASVSDNTDSTDNGEPAQGSESVEDEATAANDDNITALSVDPAASDGIQTLGATGDFWFAVCVYIDGDESKPLQGAEFILVKVENSVAYYGEFDEVAGYYSTPDWSQSMDDATTLVTGDDGIIRIMDLEAGSYRLIQTSAPDGYKLQSPITVTIDKNGNITASGGDSISCDGESVTINASSGTRTAEGGTETVTVKKFWEDNYDHAGKRPDAIFVYLLADGIRIDNQTISQDEGWLWVFEGLPADLEYTVEEAPVKNYDSSISYNDDDGYWAITNTYTSDTSAVKGSKTGQGDKNSGDAGGATKSDSSASDAQTSDTTPLLELIVVALVAAGVLTFSGVRIHRNRKSGLHR